MLIIPVKEGENIDRALKRFKRKFDRTKTMRNLRETKTFHETICCQKSSKNQSILCSRFKNQRRSRLGLHKYIKTHI